MIYFTNKEQRKKEEEMYAFVAEEMERGEINKALWTKAIAESKNDESQTKSFYIKYRIQKIKDESFKTSKLKENILAICLLIFLAGLISSAIYFFEDFFELIGNNLARSSFEKENNINLSVEENVEEVVLEEKKEVIPLEKNIQNKNKQECLKIDMVELYQLRQKLAYEQGLASVGMVPGQRAVIDDVMERLTGTKPVYNYDQFNQVNRSYTDMYDPQLEAIDDLIRRIGRNEVCIY